MVIAARNEERRIERAVRSVLDGDYPEVEVVVVLNHCTDRTGEVVRSIADARVRCLDNPGAPRIGVAVKLGISVAKADLIARLDADDFQHPDRLTREVSHLKTNSLDLCAGWAQVVDESGKPAFQQTTPTESDDIRRALRRGNVLVQSSVLMKRETLMSAGGYRDTRWEDYDLWVRLSRIGARFGCVPAVVVTRELRQDGYGASTGRSFLGRVEVVRHRLMAARAMGGLLPW